MNETSTLVLAATGAVTGLLGSVLGLGGGVFLVPLLTLSLGLPIRTAVSASLVSVIATSAMSTTLNVRRNVVNVPLGLTLLLATVTGGLFGGIAAEHIERENLFLIFSLACFLMAIVVSTRSQKRNITEFTEGTHLGALDGIIHEGSLQYFYRVKRLPLALCVSLVAGALAGLLGVGGGIVQVPILNSFCGVPIRIAAATSSFMIGPTAVAAAFSYLARGELDPRVTAAIALGSLPASALGTMLANRAPVRAIKLILATALVLVALRTGARAFFDL